jgi:MFS family permease
MKRDCVVLSSVEFVDALALGILLPVLPAVTVRFALGRAGGAALAVLPFLAALIAATWLGPLSSRWGRKSVLVATCLVSTEALFVLAWAGDVYMLTLSRFATGVAAGNVAVAEAARRDAEGWEPGARLRPAALSLALGLLAGVLLGVLGTSAGGYAAGAIAVASLVSVVALLRETLPLTSRGRVAAHVRVGGDMPRAERTSPPSRRA